VWEKAAAYVGAREIIDAALAQDFIVDGLDDPDGIQVMTIHKSKGTFRRSRKILMVGVTRARAHTMMVQQAWPQCPIMSAHNLRSAFEKA